MIKSDDVNKNVKGVSNHSVKKHQQRKHYLEKKTAGKTEVKYDFSQYEKKLVGNTWVLSKNGRTDQDAAKASLAYNEAIKKGEIKLDNEPDSDIYLEQIQAAKDGYNLWTGEELSKLESNSIIFSSLIGSVYGFRGGKISGRSIKVSKGDLGKIREKVKEGPQRTGKVISHPVLDTTRSGSALKKPDGQHGFNDIIDNYTPHAKEFEIIGGDGLKRKLYQIEGGIKYYDYKDIFNKDQRIKERITTVKDQNGIFEWIVEPSKGVTHRRFIPNGKITGTANQRP
ncbi:hypothetical protein [Niallia taxi]|uniref:hypothetical protein n=1 Tax=Niallia taxi TaxID=2499688 RepID=UPI003981CE4E